MLTLFELRLMVEDRSKDSKIPTAQALVYSNIELVAQMKLDPQTEIRVYKNGYVLYRVGNHATVFPMAQCKDYDYDSQALGDECSIQQAFFNEQEWYLRLVLEGEDRIEHNQNVKQLRSTISYSEIGEEWLQNRDLQDNLLNSLIVKEEIKSVLSCNTEKQKSILTKFFLEEKNRSEIARELNVSCQAVSDCINRAEKRIRKHRGYSRRCDARSMTEE